MTMSSSHSENEKMQASEMIFNVFRANDVEGKGHLPQVVVVNLLAGMLGKQWTELEPTFQKLMIESNAESQIDGVNYERFVRWLFLNSPDEGENGLKNSKAHNEHGASDAERRPRNFSKPGNQLQSVQAKHVEIDELQKHLAAHVSDEHEAAKNARATIGVVAEVLAAGAGGVSISVVDHKLSNMRFQFLDDSILYNIFKLIAKNIHRHRREFVDILEAFSAHSGSDRWSSKEIAAFAEKYPVATELFGKLDGQPKDGAFALSYDGDIVFAAAKLQYNSERWRLERPGGKFAGTRHASSLAFAEALGIEGSLGVVFVRSDDGGAHAFLPNYNGPQHPPECLHFDSLTPCTQEQMVEIFKDHIIQNGKQMQKALPALIRPGKSGERILTYVNGEVTSDKTIDDETSMVVRAPTVDQEMYVLSKEKFEENWMPYGEELVGDNFQTKQLQRRGFKKHWPKPGKAKWVYEIKEKDMEKVRTPFFKTSWGVEQRMKPGDCLAMPATQSEADIYLMPIDVLSTMREYQEKSCVNDSNNNNASQLLEMFKEKIKDSGRRMKAKPALIRPGKLHERIVTQVGGEVLSVVTISDDTSMVLRAPTTHHELYALSRAEFEGQWLENGKELDDSRTLHRLLTSQGFKLYVPKPIVKCIYELTAEDLNLIPNASFDTGSGHTRLIRSGDFLAVLDPVDDAHEVVFMAPHNVDAYEECVEGRDETKDVSQQEMVELFKDRIVSEGRKVFKCRPALARCAVKNERVVTCVNGRVTSDVVVDNDASMVIRAPTLDRELYVLSQSAFEKNWDLPGRCFSRESHAEAELERQGWQEYWPKPNVKMVRKVSTADLESIPTRRFIASWGAPQPVMEGDYLAWNGEEIYLMPATCLQSTYKEISSNEEKPRIDRRNTNWDLFADVQVVVEKSKFVQ